MARVLIYASLVLMVGLPLGWRLVAVPVLARHAPGAMRSLPQPALFLAAGMLIVGASALFVAQVAPLELGFSTLREWAAFIGRGLLGLMTMSRVLLGATAIGLLAASQGRSAGSAGCVVIGLLAQASVTRTSHTAAMAAGWLSVAADYGHMLGGAMWAGGLLALVVALRRMPADAEAARALTARFSPLGILAVTLVLCSGLALSAAHVPTVESFGQTSYGGLILLKLAGVGAALALAAAHKFVMQRRLSKPRHVGAFAKSLQLEACIVLAVVACAGALTSASPPHATMQHVLSDGSTMSMSMLDPELGRALLAGATAVAVAGGVALLIEWRSSRRLQTP